MIPDFESSNHANEELELNIKVLVHMLFLTLAVVLLAMFTNLFRECCIAATDLQYN
jgi:flagellar biosynthesis protein FliP